MLGPTLRSLVGGGAIGLACYVAEDPPRSSCARSPLRCCGTRRYRVKLEKQGSTRFRQNAPVRVKCR